MVHGGDDNDLYQIRRRDDMYRLWRSATKLGKAKTSDMHGVFSWKKRKRTDGVCI